MFTNGENQYGKKPHRVILRSPFPRIHYYHNKRLQVKESQYLIPNYSWTLIPILNWTCSVVTISHFQCTTPSTWLTNRCVDPSMRLTYQLEEEEYWLQSSSLHQQWRSRSTWLQNPKAQRRSSFYGENKALVTLYSLMWRPLKYSLYMSRVVRKETLHIHVSMGQKSNLKILIS